MSRQAPKQRPREAPPPDQTLHAEHALCTAIIKHAAEGLCVCHPTTEFPFVEFTVWNDRMTEITGYPMEEINDRGWYQTVYPDPEVQAKARDRMEGMREGTDLQAEDWIITRADGQERSLRISTSLLSSEGGTVHILAIMQDVTELAKSTRQLEQYRDRLEQLVGQRTAELEAAIQRLKEENERRARVQESLRQSEERFRTILEKAPVMIDSFDETGKCLLWNAECSRTLGWTQEDLSASEAPLALFYPDPETRQSVARSIQRADGTFREYAVLAKDGTTRTQLWADLRLPTGGLISVGHDITERKHTEQLLERRLQFERAISTISSRFVGSRDIADAINVSLAEMGELSGAGRAYVFLFRADGKTMDNTHEWCAEGVRPEIDNLQEMSLADFPWIISRVRNRETVHIADVAALPAEAQNERASLESQDIKSLLIMPMVIGDQVAGFLGLDNVRRTGPWGEVDHVLLRVASEIVGTAFSRLRYEEELKAQSMKDELTGLYNRRGFLLLAQQQLKTAERMKGNILVLFVDVDDLKQINDRMGHPAGDRALRDTASLLRSTFRRSDVIARLGGDEFVVMSVESTEIDSGALLRRLEEDLEKFKADNPRQFDLSLSFGTVHSTPQQRRPIEELLLEADGLMYEQKRSKRYERGREPA